METNEKMNISRRGFLKTAALVGAALAVQPTINKVKAANAAAGGEKALKKKGMQYRDGSVGSRFRGNGDDLQPQPASRQGTVHKARPRGCRPGCDIIRHGDCLRASK